MKTIYKKPMLRCIVLDSHPVMLDNSEIEISDDPVDPGRGKADSRRGEWGSLWDDNEK